ncbi:AAA family ATPase [Streptomyces sp. gb14]|uniref:AAA family ATPase n=1 Tax=Streptomyces sp. gb14 TaxID=1827753 RepID=UPI000D1B4DCA|nr:AAA family ATPase [Streptomyces sp. gb14]
MGILYGREKAIQELIDPSQSVVVVTGDGGVGKSSLLTACRDVAQESHLATVDITRLPHRTGGLQISILNQLIAVTGELVSDQGAAEKLRRKLADRASAAIGPRRKDFALAVAKEVLVAVKERVGSDTGQALGEFFTTVSTDNSESILETLHTQVDSDALQAVVDIADEVARLNGDATLYLFLENAQNLSDEDLRQLADMPSILSSRVVLRLEHRDSSNAHRSRIQLLRDAGVKEVPLRGLTEDVVAFWCRTKGVPATLHRRIYQSTNGYPLYVENAIHQLTTDRRLSGISPAENFRASTVDALNSLDSETADAARQLSAFIDPPSRENIIQILGGDMTPLRWEGIQSRLRHERIFTLSGDGDPWFHEVRRRCVWDSLSPALRQTVADRAVTFILTSFEEDEDPELLVNLALIASESSTVREDDRANHLSTASLDEIALLSSLLELAEPKNDAPSPETPMAFGDSVFDYCRVAFMPDVEANTALERLTTAEIIFVAEDDDNSVLIPRVSHLALLVALGRAGTELPRFPMLRIASTIFHTRIAPRLHEFVTCSYGIGHPRLLRSIRNGEAAHRASQTHRYFGRAIHAVFLRASIEQQPFYAYSTFADAETATRSAQDLVEAGGRHWGLTVDIEWLLQLPAGKIRSRRFTNAFERINFTPRPESPFVSEVCKKADLIRQVRAHCTRVERAILGLEEKISYTILRKGQDVMVVEVTGTSDGVRELDNEAPDDYRFAGPYRWNNLKRIMNLQPGENTSNVTFGMAGATQYDPKEILEDFARKAREYNRSQPRVVIDVSETALQNVLSASHRDAYHDAQALSAVLAQYGEVSLSPSTTLLLIYTHGEDGRHLTDHASEAVFLRFPSPHLSEDAIIVKVAECEDTHFDTETFGHRFREHLDRIPEIADGSRDWRQYLGVSDAQYWLSRELGFEDGAISFMPLSNS